jgi:hypothetical protein
MHDSLNRPCLAFYNVPIRQNSALFEARRSERRERIIGRSRPDRDTKVSHARECYVRNLVVRQLATYATPHSVSDHSLHPGLVELSGHLKRSIARSQTGKSLGRSSVGRAHARDSIADGVHHRRVPLLIIQWVDHGIILPDQRSQRAAIQGRTAAVAQAECDAGDQPPRS